MMAATTVPEARGVRVLLKKEENSSSSSSSSNTALQRARAEPALPLSAGETTNATNGKEQTKAALNTSLESCTGSNGEVIATVDTDDRFMSSTSNCGGAKDEAFKNQQIKIPDSTIEATIHSTQDGISRNDIVDSALLSALSDPRERFGLLRLEKTLVDFMKDTTLTYMEVGGPCNSVVIYPQQQQQQQQNHPLDGGTPRNGKQSRFQRLCLHRLADRFNIIRETGTELEYGGGPGLIRLVKMADSRIPSKLLIDLSEAECESNKDGDNADGLTKSLSGLAVEQGPKTPNRKMKIMKRNNSASFGSTGSLNKNNNNNNSKGRGNKGVKGKKLSDKERAYAEARARIFNNEAAAAKSEGGDRRGSTGSGGHPTSAVSSAFSSTVTSPSTTPPPPQSQASWSPPSSEVAVTTAAEVTVDSTIQLQQPQDVKNTNRPAAVSGGGVSKVTWRNRRQEENDPDFQTRHLLPQQQQATGYDYGYHGYNMNSSSSSSLNFYAGTAPQAPPAVFYPQAAPPPYYHHAQPQQQPQAPVVMVSGGSNSGTPNRNSRGRGGGYGGQRSYSDSNNNNNNGQGSKRPANINSNEEFPALG